eukprot:gene14446-19385_t
MSYLSPEQIIYFNENGFLVIEKFWDTDTVNKLKNKIIKLIESNDLSSIKTVFSTKENMRHADEYFLNSSYNISYFWEEKAVVNGVVTEDLPVACRINKIGHALHDLDEDYQAVSYEDRIGSICEDLGIEKPLITQSMYIFKQAFIGGDVTAHQDGAFLYTEPQSCLGFWWAMDDCTLDNGCLWAVPGSHKEGVNRRFRRRDPPNTGLEFSPLDPIEWDLTDAIPLLIPKGSLVILHNAIVHLSKENLSPNARHAYSIHVIDGKDGVTYPQDNWLQRPNGIPFHEITNRVTTSSK